MKETTTKEIIDRTKGITEMRMTLGHLTTLAGAISDNGQTYQFTELLTIIKPMSDRIEVACLNLIGGDK